MAARVHGPWRNAHPVHRAAFIIGLGCGAAAGLFLLSLLATGHGWLGLLHDVYVNIGGGDWGGGVAIGAGAAATTMGGRGPEGGRAGDGVPVPEPPTSVAPGPGNPASTAAPAGGSMPVSPEDQALREAWSRIVNNVTEDR